MPCPPFKQISLLLPGGECAHALVESIAGRCREVESGARNVDHILTNTLLPEMSRELLSRMAKGEQIREVKAGLGERGFVFDIR